MTDAVILFMKKSSFILSIKKLFRYIYYARQFWAHNVFEII